MKNDKCAEIIKHLNRIQGQIDALKGYIEAKRSCEDVSHLTKSITTSFSSVRASIVEEMLAETFKEKFGSEEIEHLQSILALNK